ncbi:hypothetical protein [Sphingopyxis fribergensis]|uniref:hypothetical protein n=1 Tax=Sphingopyxis fribergensis TaxID=1515612 RepID=UPI0011DE1424|nr:hypothetical protein [Sphingopyxis fribergensis]
MIDTLLSFYFRIGDIFQQELSPAPLVVRRRAATELKSHFARGCGTETASGAVAATVAER